MWKLKLFYLLLFAWNRCTYNFNFCAQRNKIWPTPLPPPSKKYNEAAGLICFLNIFLPCVSEIDIQDCRKMEGSIYRDTETWDLINSRHSEDDVKHEYKHARKAGIQYAVLFFFYICIEFWCQAEELVHDICMRNVFQCSSGKWTFLCRKEKYPTFIYHSKFLNYFLLNLHLKFQVIRLKAFYKGRIFLYIVDAAKNCLFVLFLLNRRC